MKIKYDPGADAMRIILREGIVEDTKELDDNTIIDFDKSGQVIAIEILFVKERNPDLLRKLQVENVIST